MRLPKWLQRRREKRLREEVLVSVRPMVLQIVTERIKDPNLYPMPSRLTLSMVQLPAGNVPLTIQVGFETRKRGLWSSSEVEGTCQLVSKDGHWIPDIARIRQDDCVTIYGPTEINPHLRTPIPEFLTRQLSTTPLRPQA